MTLETGVQMQPRTGGQAASSCKLIRGPFKQGLLPREGRPAAAEVLRPRGSICSPGRQPGQKTLHAPHPHSIPGHLQALTQHQVGQTGERGQRSW